MAVRKADPEDAVLIHALDTDSRVRVHMGGTLNHTIEEIRDAIKARSYLYHIVVETGTQEPVGYGGFSHNERTGGVDLLVCILPERQGNGLGSGALDLMASQFEAQLSTKRLTITTSSENTDAIEVLRRCGFECTGEYAKIPGFSFMSKIYKRIGQGT